jgi:hypothetical protein
VVAGTVLVVAALTTIPARLAARRPVTETLRAELTWRTGDSRTTIDQSERH